MKPSEKVAAFQAARKKHEDVINMEIGFGCVGLFISGFLFGLSGERLSDTMLVFNYVVAAAIAIFSVFALTSYGQRKYQLGVIQVRIQEIILSDEFQEES